MHDELTRRYDEAVAALAEVDLATPSAAVASLTQAREAIGAALDEAMALAVTSEGASVRQVASLAGIAPNSVSPRLARSTTLSGYAQQGRVDATGIALARADRHQQEGGAPMRFVRRRPTGSSS